MAGFGYRIDTVETAFQSSKKKEEYISRSVLLKRSQNRSHKLHQLPVELFQCIAEYVIDGTHPPRTLHNLASVSCIWSQVIISSPGLWRTILDSYASYEIAQSLRLSKNMPLNIRACHSGRMEDADAFFARIAASAWRWESVTSTRLTPKLKETLGSPNCNPKRIEIGRYSSGSIMLQGNVSLSHMSLWGTHVNWNSPRLSNLSSLRLTYMTRGSCPLPRDMFRILSSSPQLQCLYLVGVLLDGHPLHALQKHFPPMKFNRLHTLVLQNVSPQILYGILLSAFPTSLDVLRIAVPLHIISRPELPVIAASLQAIQDLDQIGFSLSTDFTTISVHDIAVPRKFSVSFSSQNIAVISSLLGRLPKLPAAHVHFGSPHTRPGGRPWRPWGDEGELLVPSILTVFPTVRSITVVRNEFCTPVLDFLATPTMCGGSAKWNCPELEELSFEDCFETIDLAGFVRRRWGRCHLDDDEEDGENDGGNNDHEDHIKLEENLLERPPRLKKLTPSFMSTDAHDATLHAEGECGCDT